MISRNKSQKGRIGTAYHIEKTHKQIKVDCEHYDVDDGSCYAKSIILWQVGYDICNTCKQKSPIYKEIKEKNKSKNKKAKTCKTKKVKTYEKKKVTTGNVDIDTKNIIKNSSRVREVLKIASNHCELCGDKNNNLSIYIIDKNKPSADLDSILNIIAVCPKCKSKIYSNKDKYLDTMKKIVNDRLNKII